MPGFRFTIILITLSITFFFTACDNHSSSPMYGLTENVDIQGKWLYTKSVYNTIESWKDSTGDTGRTDTSITYTTADTLEIMEILDSKLIIYYFLKHYSSDFYMKQEIPYTLSENLFIDTIFTGSESEDEYNYSKWETNVSNDNGQLIIRTHYEFKIGNKNRWDIIEYNDSYYYSYYSGSIPHESWPDSCFLVNL
jgi:hypothetical protein